MGTKVIRACFGVLNDGKSIREVNNTNIVLYS